MRQTSAMDVINRLRPKMNRLPVASAFLQPAQDLRIGGRGSGALYQYTIQSDNIADLAHWGPILLQNMQKLPGLQDVNTDQQNGGLQEMLDYDRVTAARLGQTPQSLDQRSLQRLLPVGSLGHLHPAQPVLRRDGSGAAVLAGSVGAEQHLLRPPASLRRPPGINAVSPLLTADRSRSTNTTPLQVAHTGLFPSVTVSFNLRNGAVAQRCHARSRADGTTASACPARCTASLPEPPRPISNRWPPSPSWSSPRCFAVYIVLGILYESLVHPLTIISTLPSASVGAMLALMLFHIDLNVISIIGIILLIGIVKKNAIMMIDFALQAERARRQDHPRRHLRGLHAALPPHHDDHHGGHLRRLAAGLRNRHRLGAAPPLGITIVGGLLLSQMLTLYTTPVVYLMMDRLRLRALGQHARHVAATAEGAHRRSA